MHFSTIADIGMIEKCVRNIARSSSVYALNMSLVSMYALLHALHVICTKRSTASATQAITAYSC